MRDCKFTWIKTVHLENYYHTSKRAVSYTHLDVYKRQEYCDNICNESKKQTNELREQNEERRRGLEKSKEKQRRGAEELLELFNELFKKKRR